MNLNILNYGLDFARSGHDRRVIKNINIAAILSLSGFISFGLFYAYLDFANLKPVLVLFVLCIIAGTYALYLNSTGHPASASLIIMIALTLGTTLSCFYVDRQLNVHYISLLTAYAAVTVIGVEKYKTVLFFLALNVLAFLTVHNEWITPQWYASNFPDAINFIHIRTIAMIFICSLIIIAVGHWWMVQKDIVSEARILPSMLRFIPSVVSLPMPARHS